MARVTPTGVNSALSYCPRKRHQDQARPILQPLRRIQAGEACSWQGVL